MFPLIGGSKEVNHFQSFVLGRKQLITPKENKIPNTFQDISIRQTSFDVGINTLTFHNLWNNTYCSPQTHL